MDLLSFFHALFWRFLSKNFEINDNRSQRKCFILTLFFYQTSFCVHSIMTFTFCYNRVGYKQWRKAIWRKFSAQISLFHYHFFLHFLNFNTYFIKNNEFMFSHFFSFIWIIDNREIIFFSKNSILLFLELHDGTKNFTSIMKMISDGSMYYNSLLEQFFE